MLSIRNPLGMGGIGGSARALSRSPLGIIALFIVLVYGIAGLVLSISSSDLPDGAVWPLVLFLALFPALVLGVFAWLVAKHHTKLYAPMDYPDQDGFFRALSSDEQRQRLEAEVAEIVQDAQDPVSDLEPTRAQEDSIRSRVVVAEELAIREIEADNHVSIRRHIASGFGQRFDGVFIKDGKAHFVEIKVTKRKMWGRMGSDLVRKLRLLVNSKGHSDATLLIAVVTIGLSAEQRERGEESLQRQLGGAGHKFLLRVFGLEDLEQKFGLRGADQDA